MKKFFVIPVFVFIILETGGIAMTYNCEKIGTESSDKLVLGYIEDEIACAEQKNDDENEKATDGPNRVNNIAASHNGQTLTEVIDARYDEVNHVTYENLGARLNVLSSALAENTQQLNNIAVYLDDYFETGDTNYSPALQRAIDYLQQDNKGGKILAGKKTYNFKNTVIISKNGITIEGQSPSSTIFYIDAHFDGNCLIKADNPTGAVGKFSVKNIKFDSTINTAGINGISFKYLVYNNVFENLDFEGFTGSWFYTEKTGNISEQITWSGIQGNPRNNTPTKSAFDLHRINESLMINCKVFGKQYHSYPYPTVPLVKCETPQQFTILSCNFANSAGGGIHIGTTDLSPSATIQSFFIDKCHFEDINTSDVIKVIGSARAKGEYGKIGINRYLEITSPTITINNMIGYIVEDFKPSIILESGTQQCFVSTMLSNGSTITNNGTNNLVIATDTNYQKVIGKLENKYVTFNGDYSLIELGIGNDTNNVGHKFRISADYQNTNLQRLRMLYDGTTDVGGFTNHGLYGKTKTTSGAPTITGVPEGTIVANSADNKLYVFIGGAWKSVTLN